MFTFSVIIILFGLSTSITNILLRIDDAISSYRTTNRTSCGEIDVVSITERMSISHGTIITDGFVNRQCEVDYMCKDFKVAPAVNG